MWGYRVTLQELSEHYRNTGEFLPEAESLLEIHLMSIADRIQKKYDNYIEYCNNNNHLPEETLDLMIDIEIGYWQAENGFVSSLRVGKRREIIDKLFQQMLDTSDDGYQCDMYLFKLEEMSDEELEEEARK